MSWLRTLRFIGEMAKERREWLADQEQARPGKS
jgi:hypothetical protein